MPQMDPLGEEKLRTLAARLGQDWKKVGTYLGIQWCRIQQFASDHSNTEDAIFEMLLTWRQAEPYEDPEGTTTSKLRDALIKAEKQSICDQLFPLDMDSQCSKTRMENLQRQLQEKQAQIDQLLKTHCEVIQKRDVELKEKQSTLDKACGQVQKLQQEEQNIQQEMKKAQEDLKETAETAISCYTCVRKRDSQLHQKEADLKKVHEQVQGLQQENQEAHEQVQQLQQENQEAHEQVQQLQQEKQNTKDQMKQIQERLTVRTQSADYFYKQRFWLQQQNRELQNSLADKTQTVKTYHEVIQERDSQIELQECEILQYYEQDLKQQDETTQLKDRLIAATTATEELNHVKIEKDLLESKYTYLNNKYRLSQIENNNLKMQKKSVENSMNKAAATATKELDSVKREKELLESQLRDLHNKYKVSQTENNHLKKQNMSLENSLNQELTIEQEGEESHPTGTRKYIRTRKKTRKKLSPLQDENHTLSKSFKSEKDETRVILNQFIQTCKVLTEQHGIQIRLRRPVICSQARSHTA